MGVCASSKFRHVSLLRREQVLFSSSEVVLPVTALEAHALVTDNSGFVNSEHPRSLTSGKDGRRCFLVYCVGSANYDNITDTVQRAEYAPDLDEQASVYVGEELLVASGPVSLWSFPLLTFSVRSCLLISPIACYPAITNDLSCPS